MSAHLLCGCHQHTGSVKRLAVDPFNFFLQSYHITDYRDCRSLDLLFLCNLGDPFQCSCHHPLSGGRSFLDHCSWCLRILAIGNQIGCNGWQVFQSHQKYQGSFFLCQRCIIQNSSGFVVSLMTGDHMERGCMIPVSHRDSCISRCSIAGRYPTHDLIFDACSP